MLIFKCIVMFEIHTFIDTEIRVVWFLFEHANSKELQAFVKGWKH